METQVTFDQISIVHRSNPNYYLDIHRCSQREKDREPTEHALGLRFGLYADRVLACVMHVRPAIGSKFVGQLRHRIEATRDGVVSIAVALRDTDQREGRAGMSPCMALARGQGVTYE